MRPGDRVKVLGEAYSLDDDEDMKLATVGGLSVGAGPDRVALEVARAGNWVLLEVSRSPGTVRSLVDTMFCFDSIRFDGVRGRGARAGRS